MDLIDIFRTFHPNAEEYAFSSPHGPFSRIDHIMGHKSNLSKFKKIEIISSIFSDHSAMRLDINYNKKHKHMEIKQHVSKKPRGCWRNQKGNEKILETSDNENTTWNLWDAAKVVLRAKFRAIQSYLKKREKHQIDNLALHLKLLEREEQKKKLVQEKKS